MNSVSSTIVQGPRDPGRPWVIVQRDSAMYICWLWTEHWPPAGGRQEDDSGELSVNSSISTSLIFTVYRMMWQPHFSVLSRLLQKQLLFSSLTFSIQVCNLWMKNLTGCISQLSLHWCYVKTTLNLSIAYNHKHLCSWICQSVEIWLIQAELDGIPHCWSCWGLFRITGLRISDHRNARSRELKTASQTVWWLSKNSAHTVSSTRIFLVRASHTWPGSRRRRRGSKCCLHEWEKLPSYRAWMKFLSFLSNQLWGTAILLERKPHNEI